jgi:hypothetical protein
MVALSPAWKSTSSVHQDAIPAGLVTVERQGRRRLYAADRDALSEFAPLLEAMWRTDLDRLAADVERDQEREKRE